MRLDRNSAYAVLATLYIAERQGRGPVQGNAIAEACKIPSAQLIQILQQLAAARLLAIGRGPSGGFFLGRPADKITLIQIINAVNRAPAAEKDKPDAGAAPHRPASESEPGSLALALLQETTIAELVDAQPVATPQPDRERPTAGAMS